MDWLKNLNLQQWWTVAIASGVAMTVIAAPAGNNGLVLVGQGVIACGFGEWFNHRKEGLLMGGGLLTTYPRYNRPQGLILVALGVALIAIGIYRLLTF